MLQRVIELLKPDVSTDAKLTGIAMLVGKVLDKYDSRLKTLEIKTLIPIERGEQGRPGRDADPKDIQKKIDELIKQIDREEMEDVTELMDFTWDKW